MRALVNCNFRKVRLGGWGSEGPALITHDEKITIFRLRTRMSDFGFNFRAGRDQIRCPLCGQHPDCQTFLFKCPELKSSLYEKFGPNSYDSIDEIFSETISVDKIRVINLQWT